MEVTADEVARVLQKEDSISQRNAADSIAETVGQDELNVVASTVGVWEYLEEQRSNVPKGYQKEGDSNRLSKKIATLAKTGDRKKIRECLDAMLINWRELGDLNLKGNFRYQRDSETGQEIMEAFGVAYFYSDVFGGERLWDKLPSPVPTKQKSEDLKAAFGDDYAVELGIVDGITSQRWLAGLGDVPGELGKLVYDYILENSLSLDERIKLLEDYLRVVERIYRFLEQGADFPGQIIDNSDRRGFQNTYRGMLVRITRYVEKTKAEVLQMKNISSALEAHGLEKKPVKKEEVRDDG